LLIVVPVLAVALRLRMQHYVLSQSWPKCQLTVAVIEPGQSATAERLGATAVKHAATAIAQASGLRFDVRVLTSAPAPAASPAPDITVLLLDTRSFDDPDDLGTTETHPEEAGSPLVSALISIDVESSRSESLLEAVALHELGHAVGLDHVRDADEAMNPDSSRTSLGAGDREGLRRLYEQRCAATA
jgi:hypothetical protein